MGSTPDARAREPLSGLAGPRLLAAEPDERLVALARASDERAFAAIVERYRAPLLRYCRSHLPPAAAEDALQQTFINAYSALTGDGSQAPLRLRPWLYKLAHNAALNIARDPQARHSRLHDGIDGVERPDEVVARSERLWRVVGAVRALPARQRDVIVRHAVEGESHERIAADLGVSPGSIRQLAHRARRTVRDAAAALVPVGVLRWLPWGTGFAESAPGVAGGGAVAKVAVAVVVASAAGGGAIEVAKRGDDPPERRAVAARPDRGDRAPARRAAAPQAPVRAPAAAGTGGGRRAESESGDSSGRGPSDRGSSRSGPSGGGSGSSGSGSSSGGDSDSSGPGSGSSGSGSSGSGSGSSGSGSGSSGRGSGSSGSGSGSSGSGSGSSGSGSGSSGSGSGSSGSGSGSSGSGSGSSGSGSGSSGSGSSGSEPEEPAAIEIETDSSGPGSGDERVELDSSGSGSSGSGSSGSGSGGDPD